MLDWRLISQRVTDLGDIGLFMKKSLITWLKTGGYDSYMRSRSSVDAVDMVYSLSKVDSLVAASYSLLNCEYIVQVAYDEDTCMKLIEGSIECRRPVRDSEKSQRFLEKGRYPVKPGVARVKTNVWFDDVVKHAISNGDSWLIDELSWYNEATEGLFNDQMASLCMYALAVKDLFLKPLEIAIILISSETLSKNFTTVIKGLGWNYTRVGSSIVECNSMLGRGVGVVDMLSECKKRLNRNECPVVDFDEQVLRQAVRRVFMEEIDIDSLEFDDMERFWDSRWEWCVNGSHSKIIQKYHPVLSVDFRGQMHRKVAVENWMDNPILVWDGRVYVTSSLKLELGKMRLLLSCDTVSYIAFQHLLSPIEKCWKNKRTVLDPGREGNAGMADRVRNLNGGVGINVMMDYDSFNEQHTIEAQQIVFDELIKFTGYDATRGKLLVDSFKRMLIHCEGKAVGYADATLMSGHRATSFINSVLNSAYIICSAPVLWNNFSSIHTGDDVVAKFSSYNDVTEVIRCLKQCGVRMNPIKQSVGHNCAEFLRMAITTELSTGYLARAIGSAVNGNWTNDIQLGQVELLQSAITCSTSIRNRSRFSNVGEVLCYSVNRVSGISLKTAKQLLSGEVALGNGPCFKYGAVYKHMRIENVGMSPTAKIDLRKKKSYATSAYLSKCVSFIERSAMSMLGKSVRSIMLEASYAKSLAGSIDFIKAKTKLVLSERHRITKGYAYDDELRRLGRQDMGCLSGLPILNFIKDSLTSSNLRDLVRLAGYSTAGDIYKTAFGVRDFGNVVIGACSYSDACNFSSKLSGCIVYMRHPCFM